MQIEELQAVCEQFIDKQSQIKELEEKLAQANSDLKLLSEETIPSMMEELGVEEIKLKTGEIISTVMDVYASLASTNTDPEQKAAAMGWLNDNGYGDIIKVKVNANFGREEHDAAMQLFNDLAQQGYNVNYDENVHPATLKAFIKERLQAGDNIPLSLFNANQYNKTVVRKRK